MGLDPFTLKALGEAASVVVNPVLATAPALAGEIAGQLSFPARANRQLYKKAYSDLLNNRLGMTSAEKSLAQSQSQRQIATALAPQQDLANRQAAARVASGSAGNVQAANAALANAAATAASQSQQAIEAQSTAQAQSREAQINAQMARQAEIAKQDWRRIGGLLQGSYGPPKPNLSFITQAEQFAASKAT